MTPKLQATLAVKVTWRELAANCDHKGRPGLTHILGVTRGDRQPIEVIEWRDDEGILRGVATWRKAEEILFVMVQEGFRRRGIATALMTEARKRWNKLQVEQSIKCVKSFVSPSKSSEWRRA